MAERPRVRETMRSVYCDRDLLFEAAMNLVDNTVKFTPAGGCINISAVRGKGENIIRICDTGPGIGENERDARHAALLPIRQEPEYARRRPGLKPRLGHHEAAWLPTGAQHCDGLRG